MKRLLLVLCSTVVLSLPAQAEHTRQSKRIDIPSGLPAFCCSTVDCRQADVIFLRWEGDYAWVLADGLPWKVVGRGNGEDGLYTAPRKDTWICPVVPGIARCATVKPKVMW